MTVEEYVRNWLRDERGYTLEKFGIDADNEHIKEYNIGNTQWWDQQFENYLNRVRVLGLETPNGRQAFAKFVATAVGALEAVVRSFGELPEPGVSSGYNLDNLREI